MLSIDVYGTHVKYVLLWTDFLLYLLTVAVVVTFVFARGKEHLRSPWRQVACSKQAMASLVVLSFYIVFALMDSVHFREPLANQKQDSPVQYAVEVTSVLDRVLDELANKVEKTYSAPFATHAYIKENVERNGRQVRDYKRLLYGGSHLKNPDQRLADIVITAMAGLSVGLAICLVLYLACITLLSNHYRHTLLDTMANTWHDRYPVPWREVFITAGILLILFVMVVVLSTKYHVLGTDKVGNDVLYKALKSIRTGVLIGTLTTLVMLPFAVLLGAAAGYFRGVVDDIIQYIYTTLNSIPSILLISRCVFYQCVFGNASGII